MTKKTLDKIRAEMLKRRMLIPLQNREKFDAEMKIVFQEIEKNETYNAEVERLLALWEGRVFFLISSTHCYLAPAALIRKPGENAADYLRRCFNHAEEGSL